jgi:hypothetical protein
MSRAVVPAFVVYCIAAIFAAYQTRELATRMDLKNEPPAWTDTLPAAVPTSTTSTEPRVDAGEIVIDDEPEASPPGEPDRERADSLRRTSAASRTTALPSSGMRR